MKRRVSLVAAAAVALAGCSAQDAAVDDSRVFESSPLSAFWQRLYGEAELTPEDQRRASVEEALAVQESVAACMSEQGFTYIPWEPLIDPLMRAAEESEASLRASLTDLEFAEQYGYGVLTNTWSEVALPTDPNLPAREAMSEQEMRAFDEALYGGAFSTGAVDDLDAATPQQIGCYAWSVHRFNAVTPRTEAVEAVWSSPEMTELRTAIERIPDDVARSSLTRELDEEWRACTESQGQGGHDSPLAARESIYAEHSRLSEEAYAANPESSELDPGDVAELRTIEIALATADVTCQEKVGYEARANQIQWRLEQQVLVENDDVVASLLTQVEQGG